MGTFRIEKGDLDKLLPFYLTYKEQIKAMLTNILRRKEATLYLKYILEHPDGRRRISIYCDNFAEALRRRLDIWLKDLEHAGYIRATQGFHLEDVWDFTFSFKDALSKAIKDHNRRIENADEEINSADVTFLHELLDYSNQKLSLCFLKRRDEIINRHRQRLIKFHTHATKIISLFEEEKIWSIANQAIRDIFGLQGEYSIQEGVRSVENLELDYLNSSSSYLMEEAAEALRDNQCLSIDEKGELSRITQHIDQNHFKALVIPISIRNFSFDGFLIIHDSGKVFKFDKFDWNLLYQLNYYIESMVSNCRILAELSRKREEHRDLTRRLISIQEDERKLIAGDIHDTLTQALTGIGYKALLCQELIVKDSKRLNDEISNLISNINNALKQSRQIIQYLRPQVLDDLGLITALKKVLTDFQKKSDIAIYSIFPENVDLHPEASIAIFRIFQESLRNIKRHSSAAEVHVTITLDAGHLNLQIEDDGVGFDLTRPSPGLGLITMRERAQLLKGEFSVKASPGGGCQIRVTIPMKEGWRNDTQKDLDR
jgi:two-component system sensor histidine kinase DegS